MEAEHNEQPAAHHHGDFAVNELANVEQENALIAALAIPSREQIVRLQDAMLPIQCEQPEPVHRFAPGMYMRELTIPAGMLVVGKIHKHAHFVMVLKGRSIVISEFGKDIVEAGYVAISQPGVKRVVLALEDTVFATVHLNPSDTQDIGTIESEHIQPESEYLSGPTQGELS